MRKNKFFALLLALSMLMVLPLSGCKKELVDDITPPVDTQTDPEPPVDPVDPEQPVVADQELSTSEARALLEERIDTEIYMILEADTRLEVEGEKYCVFIVADRETNKAAGQLAVNKITGTLYYYEGEGMLSDYSNFALYDPSVDAECDWNGTFTDGTRTLELMQADRNSFEYQLEDATSVARITGNTAADGELLFAFGEDGSITLSGSDSGVFTVS